MKKRKVLQASFNLEDDFEAELLAYTLSQGDVSKYLKRMIYVDKEGFRNQAQVITAKPPQENDKLREAMQSISL